MFVSSQNRRLISYGGTLCLRNLAFSQIAPPSPNTIAIAAVVVVIVAGIAVGIAAAIVADTVAAIAVRANVSQLSG